MLVPRSNMIQTIFLFFNCANSIRNENVDFLSTIDFTSIRLTDVFWIKYFHILVTLVAWFSFRVFFRLAHLALQNVNKDYVIFSNFRNFVAKSDQKTKTKNGMNETYENKDYLSTMGTETIKRFFRLNWTNNRMVNSFMLQNGFFWISFKFFAYITHKGCHHNIFVVFILGFFNCFFKRFVQHSSSYQSINCTIGQFLPNFAQMFFQCQFSGLYFHGACVDLNFNAVKSINSVDFDQFEIYKSQSMSSLNNFNHQIYKYFTWLQILSILVNYNIPCGSAMISRRKLSGDGRFPVKWAM